MRCSMCLQRYRALLGAVPLLPVPQIANQRITVACAGRDGNRQQSIASELRQNISQAHTREVPSRRRHEQQENPTAALAAWQHMQADSPRSDAPAKQAGSTASEGSDTSAPERTEKPLTERSIKHRLKRAQDLPRALGVIRDPRYGAEWNDASNASRALKRLWTIAKASDSRAREVSPASVGTAAKKIRASDAFGRLLWRAEPAAQGWSPDECADVAEQLVHLMALGLGAEVAPLLLLLDDLQKRRVAETGASS